MGSAKKRVLHVGCGSYAREKLHPVFRGDAWEEVRLDIDPAVAPDIVASITDMTPVADSSVDAVYSSHNLEHLYAHEVPTALKEFRRVLRRDGFALLTMPDLQEVARLVATGQLAEPAYVSPMGPIAPLDILFGLGTAVASGNVFMAHRTGFTSQFLINALIAAGFAEVTAQRVPSAFSLWAVAFRDMPTAEQVAAAQYQMLPLHRALAAEEARALAPAC